MAVDHGHNSVTYDDMMPEGAEGWRSRISQDFEVTVDVEGAYGYYCQPHKALGMVGLILVGDASVNFDSLKQAEFRPPKEKERWADILTRAEEMLADDAA